jgi:hypothetical protein
VGRGEGSGSGVNRADRVQINRCTCRDEMLRLTGCSTEPTRASPSVIGDTCVVVLHIGACLRDGMVRSSNARNVKPDFIPRGVQRAEGREGVQRERCRQKGVSLSQRSPEEGRKNGGRVRPREKFSGRCGRGCGRCRIASQAPSGTSAHRPDAVPRALAADAVGDGAVAKQTG